MNGRKKMIYVMTVVFITVSLPFCRCAGAQGSRHFRSHAAEPPPIPPAAYSSKPMSYRLSSKDVVRAFIKSGLEVTALKPGLIVGAPGARESTIFLLPSLGKNIGSLVSSYSSERALKQSLQFYMHMNKKTANAWRIFTKENILLLISGKVPEDTAREYEKVLSGME